MIRTLVTASSDLARAGLAAIVRGDARLAFVGSASPADLLASVAAHAPDVLLEDRDVDRGPASAVPSVALVDDPHAAWAAERLDASARGPHALLARDASAEQIAAAIVAVAAGLVAVAPRALATALDGDAPPPAEPLTAREREVLVELSRGVPNKTIAARLAISEHTVKFHIASIFAKLAVASRTEAVTQGVRLGYVML